MRTASGFNRATDAAGWANAFPAMVAKMAATAEEINENCFMVVFSPSATVPGEADANCGVIPRSP